MKSSRKSTIGFFFFVLPIVLILLIVYFSSSYQSIHAAKVDRYWTVLTNNNNTSDEGSPAVGFVALKFREDYQRLIYSVNVANIDNITGIYIYHMDNNKNVVPVLDLMQEATELPNDDRNKIYWDATGQAFGTVAVGGVTADDLQGELKGKSLRELYESMINRSIYIGITTKDFPQGEISSNSFVPTDRVFPDLSDFRWA